MFKNVAGQKFRLFAFDSATGLPYPGDAGQITGYLSKDYGAVTAITDTSPTEESATNAKGFYLLDATQAESNADSLMVSGKSSTSGIVVVGAPAIIYPRSFSEIAAAIGLRVLPESYAADEAEPTLDQMLYMIYGLLANFEFDTITRRVKKLDKTTTAATFELDSTTAPTKQLRAT